jgi:hypothetical protein
LALGVIREAVADLTRHRFGRGRRAQCLYWGAYQWIASDDRSWEFSFVNLCEVSGLSPEAIRGHALAPTAAPLTCRARRSHRRHAALGQAA